MNNSELDDILKRARAPEPPADYWDQFSKRILASPALRRERSAAESSSKRGSLFGDALRLPNLALGFGLAAASILLIVLFGPQLLDFGPRRSLPTRRTERALAEQQFIGAKKYYNEIAGLFPEHLQAIIFDERGEHILLNDAAIVPGSFPIYLKICGQDGCQRIVTFSGQQIRINGDLCDVLVSHGGEIIVAGHTFWWSSGTGSAAGDRYRIQARPLETTG
jgi:hypothetical protein